MNINKYKYKYIKHKYEHYAEQDFKQQKIANIQNLEE